MPVSDSGFVYINDYPVPYPDYDSGLQTVSTLVDGGRMADGVFRGKKVGRDQQKIELKWNRLSPDIWYELLQIWDKNFVFTLRFYSMTADGWVSRRFYVGDRSGQPFLVNPATGRPKYWKNCKANVIDTGE